MENIKAPNTYQNNYHKKPQKIKERIDEILIIEEHDMGNDSYGLNIVKKNRDGHIKIIQDMEEPMDNISHILGNIVDQIPDTERQEDEESTESESSTETFSQITLPENDRYDSDIGENHYESDIGDIPSR